MSSNQLFKDITIIDLSTVLAGPSVGTFFAELGANVIKIENPLHPDVTRTWKLTTEDKTTNVSAYFSSINYLKKYKELNLKEPEDQKKLGKLIPKASIILMNFKMGDQEKLGVTDEQLRALNPQLIIGKINGFGTKSDRVAYDLILQAESGFMYMNGSKNSGPLKMPIALIDVLAAHHLKEGLLIELLKQSKDSNYCGNTVSVSLYEAAVSSLVNQASNYLMGGKIPERIGSLHPNIAPYGELFTTKDKVQITFAIGSNLHFSKLCNWLGAEEIAKNDRFKSAQSRVENRIELFDLLQRHIYKFDAKDIIENMEKLHVPAAKIKNLKEVFESELAKEMIREEDINNLKTKRVSSIAFKLND